MYKRQAYDVLNPAGFLMVIVPVSFMQSEFWEKTRVANINSCFSLDVYKRQAESDLSAAPLLSVLFHEFFVFLFFHIVLLSV